jgi:predicted lipoprotein
LKLKTTFIICRGTMKHASQHPRAAALAAAILALAAPGCERVSYFSLGDGGSAEGGGGSAGSAVTTATTTTTSTGTGAPPVTRAAVLEAAGVCAATLYADAAAAADALASAAAAASASPDPAKIQAARDAWAALMELWQQAELLGVGPAGPTTTPGGQGKRDFVYSWPLVSRCLVEQKLVAKSYETSTFFDTALANMRGLAAVEYLLFYGGKDNACSASSSINSTGAWQALSAAELSARKLAYASAAAADVAAQVKGIAEVWSKSGGDFTSALAGAGQSGSIFDTDRLAMNVVSDGLFYLDKATKDSKVGTPLGLLECEAATCPEAVESPFARRSRSHVKNNLIGFRRVLAGCEAGGGIGFDDLLDALGKGTLAAEMVANVDAAIATAEALPGEDIAQVLASDGAKVTELHAAIKKVTDDLKTEFVTVLDLELPAGAEGDND